ncbi:MAG: penicillin-binding transpeptidase domain-containing protein [Persephonella sp.]|nr:penicillin-binding transpeptidase domain-containing protein [Persephonella sp.]
MVKNKAYTVSFLIALGFFIVILRLFYFQILKRDEYTQFIKKQYYTQEKIILPRGTIYDRNGKILAISVPTIDIFVLTKYIKNKELLAKELSLILKKPYYHILKKLNSKQNYVVIARNVDKSLKKRLLKLRRDLKEWNLGLIDSSKRFYPLGSIGGSNIGFVSKITGKGMEGLELKYDSKLGGGTGKILMMKDALGNPFTIEKEEEKDRYDIKLTIDSNIQYIAEEALKKFVRLRKPKEALILIVDPQTGNIIANATYPDYNPNLYWKYRFHKNISFQSAYEPGPFIKPFVPGRSN